jgi:transforming growth factor-beta-induced protein
LADDLSGEGPFTVFAPTDDAFAALPEGTVEALLEDPTGDLAQILLYHVAGAKSILRRPKRRTDDHDFKWC